MERIDDHSDKGYLYEETPEAGCTNDGRYNEINGLYKLMSDMASMADDFMKVSKIRAEEE